MVGVDGGVDGAESRVGDFVLLGLLGRRVALGEGGGIEVARAVVGVDGGVDGAEGRVGDFELLLGRGVGVGFGEGDGGDLV